MKAFISVSINDDLEGFILGHKLKGKDFDVNINDNWEKELDISIKRQIERSHLFVGLITTNKDINTVLNEWHYAQSKGIPNLLLVEEGVSIFETLLGNVIIFNKTHTHKAVNHIKKHMKMTLPSKLLKREDVIAWTLGGDALIDILEWFEKQNKLEKSEKAAVIA